MRQVNLFEPHVDINAHAGGGKSPQRDMNPDAHTAVITPIGLDWSRIRILLLDMDGTLLDRHFDDTFFLEVVPEAYAARYHLDLPTARQQVLAAYKEVEGTLAWYDLAYWAQRLELDISALQNKVAHLIRPHPHVMTFLQQLRERGYPLHLVTNAHAWSLRLKLAKTPIGPCLTSTTTSHDLGHPKEDPRFWQRLRERLNFNPDQALFIDDSEPILERAAAFGIGQLLHVAKPSSALPPVHARRFLSVVGLHQVPLPWVSV